MKATQIVEALLFASDAPLAPEDVARGEEDLDPDDVREAIDALRREYEDAERAFQIYEIAGGFQLLTRPEYAPYLERFETVSQQARLSGPALEVLAIVAYRQPIGRAEVEHIRGVGSAGVLRTLQERDLVEVVGRGEGLGRPLLYGTTARFLDHFGFSSLDDLPRPEDLPVILKARRSGHDDAGEAGSPEAGGSARGADAGGEPSDAVEEEAEADGADAVAGSETGEVEEPKRPDLLAEVSDEDDPD